MSDILIVLIKIVAALVWFLLLTLYLTWAERKESAVMQDRIGANRADFFGIRVLGLFQPFADAIKMMFKEDFTPSFSRRFLHNLAPFLAFFFTAVTVQAIPFGDVLRIGGKEIRLQVLDIDVGILFILAMLSFTVYGVLLQSETGFDAALYVVESCDDVAGTCLGGDDRAGEDFEGFTLSLTSDTTYYVVVDGFDDNAATAGAYSLSVERAGDSCAVPWLLDDQGGSALPLVVSSDTTGFANDVSATATECPGLDPSPPPQLVLDLPVLDPSHLERGEAGAHPRVDRGDYLGAIHLAQPPAQAVPQLLYHTVDPVRAYLEVEV